MKLKNRYFALRHGESKANVAQVILSHPLHGTKEAWTLTQKGEEQVREAALLAKKKGLLDANTAIYSSLFSRAKRSAEIAQEVLGAKVIYVDNRLRERWFGRLEGTHNSGYQSVWDKDAKNANHREFGVESAQDVQERTKSLIRELEKNQVGRKILLVSHGDALQILQTAFLGRPAKEHRRVPHLQTGEIRELVSELTSF